MSVLQFAVETLKVRHIIVCGHYGCGGVRAVLDGSHSGLVEHWLAPVRDLYRRHREDLAALADDEARLNRVCELNVAAQVESLCHSPPVQTAWQRGQMLTVHGWIYGLSDGRLRDLQCGQSSDIAGTPGNDTARMQPHLNVGEPAGCMGRRKSCRAAARRAQTSLAMRHAGRGGECAPECLCARPRGPYSATRGLAGTPPARAGGTPPAQEWPPRYRAPLRSQRFRAAVTLARPRSAPRSECTSASRAASRCSCSAM